MYQNAEIEASNDDNSPEIRGNKSYIGYLKIIQGIETSCYKISTFYHLIVFPSKTRKRYCYIMQWTLDHLVNKSFDFGRLHTTNILKLGE